MSQYTSGELAKLAGVTVRTVQYYDTRDILVPSDFSEGGRRLYNDNDLRRLRIICFLRELEIPINNIAELLKAENAEKVISVLLEQQLKEVNGELAEKEKQKHHIEILQKEIKQYENFSLEHIGDIANQMKTRKELRKTHRRLFGIGVIGEIMEYATLAYAIINGIWWPFLIALCILILTTVCLIQYYYNNIAYICPECHEVYRPMLKEFFFAKHTLTTRKLTCIACGHHGFCVEVYHPTKQTNNQEMKGK